MSLAAAAPAGSPRPWPRPLWRGDYGGSVGSCFLKPQGDCGPGDDCLANSILRSHNTKAELEAASQNYPSREHTQARPRRGSAPAPEVARRRESACSVGARGREDRGALWRRSAASSRWESTFAPRLGSQRFRLGILFAEAAGRGRATGFQGLRKPRSRKQLSLGPGVISQKKYFNAWKMNSSARASEAISHHSVKPPLKRDEQSRLVDIINKNGQLSTKNLSASIIQYAWVSYLDRKVFRLLKQTICAVELYASYEILKNVSPTEAKLIKDPCMKCKIRFRFGGETFPPIIMFKIFLHTEGRGCKFINGKELFKSSGQAVADAYKIMGRRTFCRQIMEDDYLQQRFKITDEVDIVTLQDYMQYCSLLDKIPAYSGGKSNSWRRLNLENIPRTMMIYDIVNYAHSGIISKRLRKEMNYLLQKPKSKEMHLNQLRIISEVRFPLSSSRTRPSRRPPQAQSEVKHLGRRSKQALMKLEKIKKIYKIAKEKDDSATTKEKRVDLSKCKETLIFSTPSFDILQVEELPYEDLIKEEEEEEEEVFTWFQDVLVNPKSKYTTK
ncbi:uncharacterized protein CXorf58 homolog [Erinaceus europaeus]|uniref:Uncharacterized protein CXorf58 homolog n=1 Tax=Erinaceus europaeus TaxID=9365 RepID=A0ABM3WQ19_ERIEU|nr:uncharacterized protein CXorf58 homolog [Erinaceus europaeus]